MNVEHQNDSRGNYNHGFRKQIMVSDERNQDEIFEFQYWILTFFVELSIWEYMANKASCV